MSTATTCFAKCKRPSENSVCLREAACVPGDCALASQWVRVTGDAGSSLHQDALHAAPFLPGCGAWWCQPHPHSDQPLTVS